MERELEKMPKETLIFRKDNFGYRYYAQSCENGRKTRIYLTDPEDIKRLFRKKLLQAWAKDYRADLRATNSYLDKSSDFSATKKLLSSEAMRNILISAYDEWQNADWCLSLSALPNRYEPRMILSGETVYPDFMIIHPVTKKVFLWEHFGKMDDPDYEQRAYEKIALYRKNGFFPDRNFIMTFEDRRNPLTNRQIKAIIEYHFGDWLEICGV